MVEQPRWAVCDASPSMGLVEIYTIVGEQPRWAVCDASPSMSLVEIFDRRCLASVEANGRRCVVVGFGGSGCFH